MQSLRIVRRRIRSVENMQKLTRAMEMVAASKLKRAQGVLFSARPYFIQLGHLKDRLLKSYIVDHPLLRNLTENNIIACLIFTSDTGLCGSYNSNIIHFLEGFLREYNRENICLALVGKKGASFFKRKDYFTLFPPVEMGSLKDKSRMVGIAKGLIDGFLQAKYKEVWVAYTKYLSTVTFRPVIERLLPIEVKDLERKEEIQYILEPDLVGISNSLLPAFVTEMLWQAFLESFTSEQSARMIAMKSATDNAEEMIDDLTLLRNKVRQASITKELAEVVATSEALR